MDTCVILFKQPSAHHIGHRAERNARKKRKSPTPGKHLRRIEKARHDHSGDRAEQDPGDCREGGPASDESARAERNWGPARRGRIWFGRFLAEGTTDELGSEARAYR